MIARPLLRVLVTFGSTHLDDFIEMGERIRQRLLDNAKMFDVDELAERDLLNACLGEPIAKAACPCQRKILATDANDKGDFL